MGWVYILREQNECAGMCTLLVSTVRTCVCTCVYVCVFLPLVYRCIVDAVTIRCKLILIFEVSMSSGSQLNKTTATLPMECAVMFGNFQANELEINGVERLSSSFSDRGARSCRPTV